MSLGTTSLVPNAKRRIRILLADPQRLVLDCLQAALESAYDVIATVADGRSLMASAQKLKPELIISEISLPAIDGIHAALHIREILPETKFIFLTARADATALMSALCAGGAAYLLKTCSVAELKSAIRDVLTGIPYITSAFKQGGDGASGDDQDSDTLTAREREVLKLISQGHSYRMIANVLRVSAKTVAFHKTNIRRKLALHSTAELTKYALLHGLAES